jgi:hypothetical protein
MANRSLFPPVLVDGVPHKTCTKCQQEKPADAFYFDKKEQRYKSYCRECDRLRGPERNRRRRIQNGQDPTPVKTHALRPTPGTIQCKTCGMAKPASEFACKKVRCRVCASATRKQRWATDPAYRHKALKASRNSRIYTDYGLTPVEYQQKTISQNNRCAICGREETALLPRGKGKRHLAIDHNHQTGQVRDLLCAACNTALGLFDEDVARILRAVDYIAKWRRA